jgi:hypothetical protein
MYIEQPFLSEAGRRTNHWKCERCGYEVIVDDIYKTIDDLTDRGLKLEVTKYLLRNDS